MTGNEIDYKGYIIFNYLLCGAQTFAVELEQSTIEFSEFEAAKKFIDELEETEVTKGD